MVLKLIAQDYNSDRVRQATAD